MTCWSTVCSVIPNPIHELRNRVPNIYIIFATMFSSIWFGGLSRLWTLLFPTHPLFILVMLGIPLVFFLGDDGKLNELFTIRDVVENKQKEQVKKQTNHDADSKV